VARWLLERVARKAVQAIRASRPVQTNRKSVEAKVVAVMSLKCTRRGQCYAPPCGVIYRSLGARRWLSARELPQSLCPISSWHAAGARQLISTPYTR